MTEISEITKDYVFNSIPVRNDYSNKGTFGRLINICGSYEMSGAAVLSSAAALRCGVGLVSIACPKSVVPVVASGVREATFIALPEKEALPDACGAIELISAKISGYSSCVIGPGMGSTAYTAGIVKNVLKYAVCPVVIDADGLNSICGEVEVLKSAKTSVILTPHIKEASRLMKIDVSELLGNKAEYGLSFARKYNVVLVLKDSNTLVFTPSGNIFQNNRPNSGLSKGGSGDILAGIIGALSAQGMDAVKAASCGVWLHSEAGRLSAEKYSKTSMIPGDMLIELAYIFKENGR